MMRENGETSPIPADITIDAAEEFLSDLLPEAGTIALEGFGATVHTETVKIDDFSTVSDIMIDAFLMDRISERFPQAYFLTEEMSQGSVEALPYLENLFVIDPIDGTVNFSRGNPNFGISVALLKSGEPQFGALYLPANDQLITARVDQPGVKVNGESPDWHTSDVDVLSKAVVLTDMPHDPRLRPFVAQWIDTLQRDVRRVGMEGSAVADLAKLAQGKIDGYIHPGLKPWDVAAASLILRNSGVVLSRSNGSRWNTFSPDLVASNPHIHNALLDKIPAIQSAPESLLESSDFLEKKTAYFSQLAANLKSILYFHRDRGMWVRNDEGERDWGNVTGHCLVEAARANIFAELLDLDDELKDDMIKAAGLHDFYKKDEIQKLRENNTSWEAYAEAQVEAGHIIEAAGVKPRVIRLATAVGHETVPEAEELLHKLNPSADEIAWLVMHLIDDYTVDDRWAEPAELNGTILVNDLDRRMQTVFANSQPGKKYYGINQAGIERFGEPTYNIQYRVGKMVEARVAELVSVKNPHLNLQNGVLLPEIIDGMVAEKIAFS